MIDKFKTSLIYSICKQTKTEQFLWRDNPNKKLKKIENERLIAKKQNVRILLTCTMCSQDKLFVSRINQIHTEKELRFRDKVCLNKLTNNQLFKQ